MKAIVMAAWMLAAQVSFGAMIEGEITLKFTDDMFDKGAFDQTFGDVVKATCQWHAGKFFEQETVFAGIQVKNTGSKPMFFHYYVGFFDKDHKLVGSTGQGSFGKEGLKPGEETQMGSCLIQLPKNRYKDIKYYQAVLYESDAMIGK